MKLGYSCKNSRNDFQQCKAYDWEDSLTLWANSTDTKKYLRKALVTACAMYRVPVPALLVLSSDYGKQGLLSSNYDPDNHVIRLRPRHRNLAVLLHETAHAIVDWIIGPFSKAAHGKLWLGVYIELLYRFRVLPRHVLIYSAKHAGLKWDKYSAPKIIRKRHAKMVRAGNRWRRIRKQYG